MTIVTIVNLESKYRILEPRPPSRLLTFNDNKHDQNKKGDKEIELALKPGSWENLERALLVASGVKATKKNGATALLTDRVFRLGVAFLGELQPSSGLPSNRRIPTSCPSQYIKCSAISKDVDDRSVSFLASNSASRHSAILDLALSGQVLPLVKGTLAEKGGRGADVYFDPRCYFLEQNIREFSRIQYLQNEFTLHSNLSILSRQVRQLILT